MEIREYTNFSAAGVVDREAGTIGGVKLLGTESRNGRTYPAATIAKAARLYEGAKVNLNHPEGHPGSPRQYQDRLGSIVNVTIRGDGLYADLRFNPKHPVAEQLLWDAEHSPENVGLSHNVTATIVKGHDGKTIVEEISRVQSVDLVADPATTKGLFESDQSIDTDKEEDMGGEQLTLEVLQREHGDLVTQIQEAVIKKQGTAEKIAALEEENKTLKATVDDFEARDKLAAAYKAVDKLIEEAKLPKELVTDHFRQTLVECDAESQAAWIKERQEWAGRLSIDQKPTSRAPTSGGHTPTDYKSFVKGVNQNV